MFDRLHTKRCSSSEMARALSVAGVSLSAPDLAELCALYADPAQSGQVKFQDLCDDVDTVFVVKRLETSPKSPVATAPVPRSPQPSSGPASVAERELAESAVAAVAHQARVHGVAVKDFFQDFDHGRCGAVGRDEFLRGLNQLDGAIGPLAAQALAQCYSQV